MDEAPIPLSRPCIDDREADAARRVLRSGWVMQGAEVAAFEQEFGEAVGAPHACAVSSGTAALHLALRAVGVGPGDEVVTASYSYIATANAVRHCGAVPVFADIEPDGPNLDPGAVEGSIGPRTKAILCVHQMGMPCNVDRLAAMAARHGVSLVEDAACALGSETRLGRGFVPVGRPHGDVACFSFHPRKIVTTGEGGMLTTRRPDLDRRFRLERQHGTSPSQNWPGAPSGAQHVSVGYNYRMTDLQAAVGRVQLARLPDLLATRRSLADRYRRLLAGLPVGLPQVPAWARPNWQSFWIRLPPGCSPAAVTQHMLASGVAARAGIPSAHREPAYATEPWAAGPAGLARSERASDESLLLPLFPGMAEADQDRVAAALARALKSAGVGATT